MKKLLSIVILSSLLFNIFGYYFTFYIIEKGYKKQFRKYIQDHINAENCEMLVISEDEMSNKKIFKWIEDDEFRYKGKMYDVVTSYKKGNEFIFYVVNDKNEEKLLSRFENYLKYSGTTSLPFQQNSRLITEHIIKFAVEKNTFHLFYPSQYHVLFFNYFFSIITTDKKSLFRPPEML